MDSQRVTAGDDAASRLNTRHQALINVFCHFSLLDFTMTNEEPLPKKVSVFFFFFFLRKPSCLNTSLIILWASVSNSPLWPSSLQVRLSESDMKTLTREELCTR